MILKNNYFLFLFTIYVGSFFSISIYSIKDLIRKGNCIEIKSAQFLSSRKFDTRITTKKKIKKIVSAEAYKLCS